MEPALVVAALALVFVGAHVGLATQPVRGRLVDRLGEGGFFAVYSLTATLTFWSLIAYYARHRLEGAPGLALGAVPFVRAVLLALVAAGCALAAAGLAAYPRSPVALLGQTVREPRGVARITRHPFFAGTALVGAAHALLAPHLSGAVLMGALVVLAVAGARHQDAKHLERQGRAYADHLAVTSFVPFAAILAGRQRLAWRELPLGAGAIGLGAALLLRSVHAYLFAADGRWLVLAVAGGGAIASLQSWRRMRRRDAQATFAAVRQ